MSYEEIVPVVRRLAREYDIRGNRDRLRSFMNAVFDEVSRIYGLCRSFQRRAVIFGVTFEAVFAVVVQELFPDIKLLRECEIREACLMEDGRADFVVVDQDDTVRAIIEAKGSADYIVCGGRREEVQRPGLIRTDTVKKAVANAAQAKYGISMDMPYIIVTSHKPLPGTNSDCILKISMHGKLIDMVVDVTNIDDLNVFADYVRKVRPSTKVKCSRFSRP